MIVDQLPNLAQFFGAYFHQDWDLEADDALGVIRNYMKETNFPSTQQTIKEIEQLITPESFVRRTTRYYSMRHEL